MISVLFLQLQACFTWSRWTSSIVGAQTPSMLLNAIIEELWRKTAECVRLQEKSLVLSCAVRLVSYTSVARRVPFLKIDSYNSRQPVKQHPSTWEVNCGQQLA